MAEKDTDSISYKSEQLVVGRLTAALAGLSILISLGLSAFAVVSKSQVSGDEILDKRLTELTSEREKLNDSKYFPMGRGVQLETQVGNISRQLEELSITVNETRAIVLRMDENQRLTMRHLNLKPLDPPTIGR